MQELNQYTTTTLLNLERQRDQLTRRVERLCAEQDSRSVDGFLYVAKDGMSAEQRAAIARGRLMCSLLAAIDDINRSICRVIAPWFAPIPSAGFSDRVMRGLLR